MLANSNRLLVFLTIAMGIVVILSNYLVQFPVKHYGLQEILTYGAFTYPITFLITDLTNKAFGKKIARKIVNIGFLIGILLTLFVSTNFSDYISVRIAIGSGVAFLVAQNVDINIFDKLRQEKKWFVAPFVSSLVGSIIDTFIFFTISFYKTGVPWVTLALGDFCVKLLIALTMLIPFRLFFNKIKSISSKSSDYKTV